MTQLPANEAKDEWCVRGEAFEADFLKRCQREWSLPVQAHPDKLKGDKYATDLWMKQCDIDLKAPRTPFFTAAQYGYDPAHTVTLNHKDYIRYSFKYPEWSRRLMVILFWVEWPEQDAYGAYVPAVSGLWSLRLPTLDEWVRCNRIRCHTYQQRNETTGTNGRYSWLIDLRQCHFHPRTRW